jgi:restriction endonuclease Mrr
MAVKSARDKMIRPVLEYLGDGNKHTSAEIQKHIRDLQVSDAPTTNSKRKNWVAFALVNLQRAEAIIKVGQYEYQINQRGSELLQQGNDAITIAVLKQYPEMRHSLHLAAVKANESRRAPAKFDKHEESVQSLA